MVRTTRTQRNATTGPYVQLRNVIYKTRNSSMQQQRFNHLANTDCNYHITEQHDQLRVARMPSRPQRQAWQKNMTLGMTITGYLLAFHRILRQPLKMIPMIDIRDICNVIYNARSNKHHPPTSPNAAPATKNDTHHSLS